MAHSAEVVSILTGKAANSRFGSKERAVLHVMQSKTGIYRTIKHRGYRPEDIFFSSMSLLILAVVVFGFAQSYFLPGMVFAKLPNRLVHIHGALFVSWILLMVVQNTLVVIRKVQWHRTLGVLGVILPPFMVVFGLLTVYIALPLLVGAYDLWSTRRIQRVTMIAYGLMTAGMLTLIPVAGLGFVHEIVGWIRRG